MSGPAPLGSIFNEVATLYDEVRPGYPTAIIDAITALAALPPEGKILEIGCGTGQITIPFALRGYTILALEPGDALAALAVQKCRPYPRVEIVRMSFEAWPVRRQAFDLVLAAQAFHWIAPEYGCAKAADALKPGGALAIVGHHDVSQDTAFWQATLPIYETYFPVTSVGERNVSAQEVLCRSDVFDNLREVRHAWDKIYHGADYIKLLHTFSDHRALPEPDKTQFFRAIEEVIHSFGGVVHRKYEMVLLLARKTREG
jgi:SAM-dependent methyltransferase